MKKNILAENMKRFATKNLSESDLKRIEEQQAQQSITDKYAAASWSSQWRKTNKYKAKTADGLKTAPAFDWITAGMGEMKKGTYYLNLKPRVNVWGQDKTKWPFEGLQATYDQFNAPDKISIDVEGKGSKKNLASKGFDNKALIRDMKISVAKKVVKYPYTKI